MPADPAAPAPAPAPALDVAIWAWHVPYLHLLARALPDVRFYALPTPYNPDGWNDRQRPRPPNVAHEASLPGDYAVVIAQTLADLGALSEANYEGPLLYLAHNHHDLEGWRSAALWLDDRRVPLVCISDMKAAAWRAAGYNRLERPITVIPPGIPLEDHAAARERGWNERGHGGYTLTVCNNIRRPLFDLDWWLSATEGEDAVLVGEGNDGIPGSVGPAPSWDALKEMYARAGYYLNPTRPPYEDAYNLASLEAAASGCPVANLHGAHPPIAQFPFAAFAQAWRTVLHATAERTE